MDKGRIGVGVEVWARVRGMAVMLRVMDVVNPYNILESQPAIGVRARMRVMRGVRVRVTDGLLQLGFGLGCRLEWRL